MNDKPTEKQLKYIESVCKFLRIDNPNPKTKDEAKNWLSANVPTYKKKYRQVLKADEPMEMFEDPWID